jgi:hypothetical protein
LTSPTSSSTNKILYLYFNDTSSLLSEQDQSNSRDLLHVSTTQANYHKTASSFPQLINPAISPHPQQKCASKPPVPPAVRHLPLSASFSLSYFNLEMSKLTSPKAKPPGRVAAVTCRTLWTAWPRTSGARARPKSRRTARSTHLENRVDSRRTRARLGARWANGWVGLGMEAGSCEA